MINTTFRVVLVASAIASALAADVNVPGTSIRSGAGTATRTTAGTTLGGTDISIASSDILNRPTALLNKNALSTGNNIFITRSNLIFTQNDRMAMRKKVHEALETASTSDTDMGTAVLTKSVLRAVSAPTSDATLQTKASAVVAAKGGDQTTLMKRIADLVDAAAQREMDHEQTLQSKTPSGVIVLVGTKDVLRQPSAIVNKNIALTDDQINIVRSQLTPTQNDQIRLTGGAKVADAILPASAVDVGTLNAKADAKAAKTEAKTETADESDNYRVAFVYPKKPENRDAGAGAGHNNAPTKEHLGMWGPGWGMGWRYPLSYWNSCGASLYGGGCGLGLALGPFYYC